MLAAEEFEKAHARTLAGGCHKRRERGQAGRYELVHPETIRLTAADPVRNGAAGHNMKSHMLVEVQGRVVEPDIRAIFGSV
jgi:hypothetical protein